jgi:DnaJ-class molecular chaperone
MGVGRVKVVCHTCNGKGVVDETAYPSTKPIKTLCPECNGDKYVYADVKT